MSRVSVYCLVSSVGQTIENQVREMHAAGFKVAPQRTILETVSGSVSIAERKGFGRLIDKLETGDEHVVTKLDRLGRNAMDVQATVEALTGPGVRVHRLALGGMDLTSAAGEVTMGVWAAMTEFERDLLIERTQSGLAGAKAAGTPLGRPQALPEAHRGAGPCGSPMGSQWLP